MTFTDQLIYKFLKADLTYSQSGEDRILAHLFNSMGKRKVSYLDIGTNHPLMNNNTYYFYKNGGSGVCVEPNPALCRLIRRKRSRDKCLNIGIGRYDMDASFYVMSSHTLSTFSKEEAEQLHAAGQYKIEKILTMPVQSINSIIAEHFTKAPDLVSIDVEGWNEEIVENFDFGSSRPYCFCVETIGYTENNTGEKLKKIFNVFEMNNYRIYADTNLNTIFIDNQ